MKNMLTERNKALIDNITNEDYQNNLSDIPNELCNHAYIQGLLIYNNFASISGEINALFETKDEKLFVWTHDENVESGVIIKVNLSVKEVPFWKNISSIIWMALQHADKFEFISTAWFEYKWIYNFSPKVKMSDQTFFNVGLLESLSISSGKIVKATDIGNLASKIELMVRDDVAYTALMSLCSSLIQHPICLTCELSHYPHHNHLFKKPEIWEHAMIIPNIEMAIVQACKCAEGILGQPPNSKNKQSVYKHKADWKEKLGLDPDSNFEKANMSYWEFYNRLFFDLRNPSAHSSGTMRYEIEREKTVQAQCFAAIIVDHYFEMNELNLERAQKKLKFNVNFLDRAGEDISARSIK